MKDDGIGDRLIRELRKQTLDENVLLFHYEALDLSTLFYFDKSSKVILIDAVKSGARPGAVSKYAITSPSEPILQLPNLHELQLYDMIDLADQKDLLSCPFVIIGVEPKDCNPGEGLSPEIEEVLPCAIKLVLEEIENSEVGRR